MESIATPLRRLQEEGAWFARASELRLFWVTTPASMRSAALSSLCGLEFHADNHSLYVTLELPWSGSVSAAHALSDQFAERFHAKARALHEAGIDIAPCPLIPTRELEQLPWQRWVRDLARARASIRPPLAGLVILLAPVRLDQGAEISARLRALIAEPTLSDVRWIVLECDSRQLAPLIEELGSERALSVDVSIDEAAQQRDLAALAGPVPDETALTALPHPWGPWSSRGAMPSVAAPRRRDERTPPTDEALIAAGLEPGYLKGGAQQLQRLMLNAALALRQGRKADAIRLQTRTAELCGRLQLHREQVMHLLVLGGYLLADAQPEPARSTYQVAARLAAENKLLLQQAQAELGLGMLHALQQKSEAARHYAAAGRLAEAAEVPALAIECWRMAGQVASEGQAQLSADECWRRALELARSLDPEAARATSAADVARLLANASATRGQATEADRLHRQAFRIEHGVNPGSIEH